MQLHVYRLSDDSVPVVVISRGPLRPRPWSQRTVRELVGVYTNLADARAAARKARDAEPSEPRNAPKDPHD